MNSETKVFGIGLNKTGTTTLHHALQMLGYQNHHTVSELLTRWVSKGQVGRVLRVAESYTSFEDWPWPLIYQELYDYFPNAKFILTKRASSAVWFKSLCDHADMTGPTHMRRMAYGYTMPHFRKDEHISQYEKHNEEVVQFFAQRDPSKLLVVSWEDGDGWPELCRFLNKPLPDQPFPVSNQGYLKRDGVKKPNFFILGAAKSGTTSMHHYLGQHPDIFMTAHKEPTFFCEDFQVVSHPVQYFNLFDAARGEKVIGESSHGYFTDPKVPRIIKGLFQDARFLVMLRNPAERAYSHYVQLRSLGFERISSFEKALLAEEGRFSSRKFKQSNPQYLHNFFYFRTGLYGLLLQRYFSLFPREQFKIITTEQFNADPVGEIRRIFSFLGVDPDFTPDFTRHNEGSARRSALLTRLYNSRVINNKVVRRTGFRQFLIQMNYRPMDSIAPETRERLMALYEEDQQLLHRLTGIKFS